jgi:hypothetical protein
MTVRPSNSRSNGDVLLDRLNCFDDTLIVYVKGDNGASAEGTVHGAWSAPSFQNGVPEDPEWLLDHMDDFGTWGGVITLFVDHEAVDEARVQRRVPIERLAIARAQANAPLLCERNSAASAARCGELHRVL